MAYYPLKVKDSGGTVHVVGDPRIADKADKASPALTGTPTAPTAAADTNTTQLATTEFVIGQASATAPANNAASAAVGTSNRYARADHVHPTTGLIVNTLVDAKGDIITATADNTPARLAVGATNGHVLKVNSATDTGLEWGAVSVAGEDDQVVLAVQVFG